MPEVQSDYWTILRYGQDVHEQLRSIFEGARFTPVREIDDRHAAFDVHTPGAGDYTFTIARCDPPAPRFVQLDGGTIDLGIMRDSTLSTTNDFRVFGENFERFVRDRDRFAEEEVPFDPEPFPS